MIFHIGDKTIPASEVTWDDLPASVKFKARQTSLKIANMFNQRWITRLEAAAAMNESRATGIQLVIWKIYSFFKVEK